MGKKSIESRVKNKKKRVFWSKLYQAPERDFSGFIKKKKYTRETSLFISLIDIKIIVIIMARITRSLLQKRSEHNENIVRTLREVSLHQQKLESIDACLQRDCRELRILLLHDNQIRKLGEKSERDFLLWMCAFD